MSAPPASLPAGWVAACTARSLAIQGLKRSHALPLPCALQSPVGSTLLTVSSDAYEYGCPVAATSGSTERKDAVLGW